MQRQQSERQLILMRHDPVNQNNQSSINNDQWISAQYFETSFVLLFVLSFAFLSDFSDHAASRHQPCNMQPVGAEPLSPIVLAYK